MVLPGYHTTALAQELAGYKVEKVYDLEAAFEAVEEISQHAKSVFRRPDHRREDRCERLRSAGGARLDDRR